MDDLKLTELSLSERAKQRIHKYISKMELEKSNKLPSEETLAKIIGVSRVTIRKALDDLAAEGIVFRRQGKGTFVNVDSLNIKVKFNPAMEFLQMIRKCGYEPSVRLLNIQEIPCDDDIGGLLQLDKSCTLVRSEKFFLADDKICAYCMDYFDISLIGGSDAYENFSKYESSVFKYIYSYSKEKIEWDKVEIDTVLGKDIPYFMTYVPDDAYGCKPYLRLKGVDYNSADKPLVYAEEYIDTSLIKFSMIRQRMIHYDDE